jgi:hypothetical protein
MPTAVPRSLRELFFADSALACLSAVPLFVAPRLVLGAFGWITIDPVCARLVAASVFALGVRSSLMRNSSLEVYRELVALKLLWSLGATAALIWSAMQGAPVFTWALAAAFAVFFSGWTYWWRRLLVSSVPPPQST